VLALSAEHGSENKRILRIVVILLAVLIIDGIGIVAVLAIAQSRTVMPNVGVIDFQYVPYSDSSPYVTAEGAAFNYGPYAANNVTVVVEVYVNYIGPRGVDVINSTDVNVGTLPVNSPSYFNVTVSYPSGITYRFYSVGYDVLFGGRIRLGLDFIALVSPLIASLLVLDVYVAHRTGFFVWMKERRRVIGITVGWSALVALVMILAYWLVFVGNPWLISQGAAVSSNYPPQLGLGDYAVVFLASLAAGAIISDLEAVVYSYFVSVILSFAFALTYISLFMWYIVGVGGSLTITTAGIDFFGLVQATVQTALSIVFSMMIVIAMFCLLGVFLGAFLGSYLQPPYSEVPLGTNAE
jgi:hypothetical protein